MKNNFKSTKFWLTIIVFGVSTLLFAAHFLNSAEWKDMVMTAMAVYAGANVIEQFKKS